MDIIKCGMPGCKNYMNSYEAKVVKYKGKHIHICESCDDGTLEPVKSVGDKHGKQKNKVEKIKKHKNRGE